jgi:UDP-glucose:(heptosyl)LPS alpha-1,3-glucosyltransferase
MNIAFCYESVLPARGGCETYIVSLARRLAADGHELHLYACEWDAAALPRNIHYHLLPWPRGPRFLRPWQFGRSVAQALRDSRHDASIGFDKLRGPDILYPQGGLHAASAHHNVRKYRHPAVCFLAGVGKFFDLAHWSFSLLERRAYGGRDRPLIIAISAMVARHFQQYHGIDAAGLRVIPCAIDAGRFDETDRPRRRMESRRQWGIGPEDTVALFIAMNYRLKGLDPLLRAVRRLPDDAPFRLLVVGDPHTAAYERRARRLGIGERVRFVGPRRDIQQCYFAADFLVHPTFYDSFSLVVLEAMALGLPVITTRHSGASELLSPPRQGYVISDPHDADQLAWCMGQFLDPARRAACARGARQTAASWTFEDHYRKILDVFVEAAARKHAA